MKILGEDSIRSNNKFGKSKPPSSPSKYCNLQEDYNEEIYVITQLDNKEVIKEYAKIIVVDKTKDPTGELSRLPLSLLL